ncbi:hypothetical protein [Flagellimonas oceanensis]|uniref:hypothetical protein n=1 Tax=Flagellimonas oceanensis TaxID=2499163 RepID=UPI003BAC68BD
MEEKVVIENFDFLIKNLKAKNGFSINNELFDKFEPKSSSEREYFFELCDEIREFGISNGYLLKLGKRANNSGYFNLTEKGLELKKFGKGNQKFVKKLKSKPLDWYKVIPIVLTVVFGSLNLYQNNEISELKDNLNKKQSQIDSCSAELNQIKAIHKGDTENPFSTTSKPKSGNTETEYAQK